MGLISRCCFALSKRYFLALMCMCGLAIATLNRIAFGLIIIDMIYNDNTKIEKVPCPNIRDSYSLWKATEEFLWGTQIQSIILTAWSIGYAIGRLPAALIIDRFGAKTMFGYGVFIPGICSILTPVCARISPYAAFANRIVMGMFSSALWPCMAWFAARWFPTKDLGFMLAFMFVGRPLGHVIYLPLVHSLVHASRRWTLLYYSSGLLTVLWAYIWQAFTWDDPFVHPYISTKELDMLADKVFMYASDSELEPGWSWPWKSMLTSAPLWTLSMAHLGIHWIDFFLKVIIPILYLPEVHNYYIATHHYLTLALSFAMGFTVFAAGIIHDRLVKARFFNNTHLTKMYFTISSVIGSLLLIGVMHSECALTTVFIYILFALICFSVGMASTIHACVCISPNFAATTVALVTLLGNISGNLQIMIVEKLTEYGTISKWKSSAYMNATVIILTTAIYLKWGSCQLQHWNMPKQKKPHEIDYEQPEVSKKDFEPSDPEKKKYVIPTSEVPDDVRMLPSSASKSEPSNEPVQSSSLTRVNAQNVL